jgi:hypothetical protein
MSTWVRDTLAFLETTVGILWGIGRFNELWGYIAHVSRSSFLLTALLYTYFAPDVAG